MFHCRLTAPGWETFTGSMGFNAMFENGLSVLPLDRRQIARIGSSTMLVNDETGEQVGPAVVHHDLQPVSFEVPVPLKTQEDETADFEFDRDRLAAEEEARVAADAAALADAQAKAAATVEAVVYTRAELEAIGGNDGIEGLREIARPLGVRGRAIGELVTEILAAQTKLTVA